MTAAGSATSVLVQLDPRLRDAVLARATCDRVTVADVIRAALRAYVATERKS